MYSVFGARKIELNNNINQANYRLMEINQELQDLSIYSSSIADGQVTQEELANAPSSIFNSLVNFMNNATMSASTQAQALASQSGNVQNFQNFYQQVMSSFIKTENARVANIENDILKEKLRLETQIKAWEQESQVVSQSEEKNIQRAAPKYS